MSFCSRKLVLCKYFYRATKLYRLSTIYKHQLRSVSFLSIGKRNPSTHSHILSSSLTTTLKYNGPYISLYSSSTSTSPILDQIDSATLMLSDEAKEFKQHVQKFAQEIIAPLAVSTDLNDDFPHHLWPILGDYGLLGITAPEEFGGLNQGYLFHCLAVEEIARASASIAVSYATHSNLNINQLTLNGTNEQKQKYLPDLIAGKKIGALAMSETSAGSDVMSMKLRAVKKGNSYVLNGHKFWITNGPNADVLIVYTKTEPELHSRGVTAFIVEKTMAGFSCSRKLDKLGIRGSNTGELQFEDVEVHEDNILGEYNGGTKVLMSGLDYERLVLAAAPLGIMQACMDIAFPYVFDRQQFGRPVGTFQIMQGKIADMYVETCACRSYLYSCAMAADAGYASRKDCAGVILYLAEKATQMALQAIQCLGGNGYMNEYATGRLLRDAKLFEIGAGTSEVRRYLIGKTIGEEMLGKNEMKKYDQQLNNLQR